MNAAGLHVKIHTDGGSRGNPGPAAAGVVITSGDGQRVLKKIGVFLGPATNNVAEYRALLTGLAVAIDLGAQSVEVFSDSQLLVRQMNGQYRVKNAGLKDLFTEACRLADGFEQCKIHHVRREQNQHADEMVNRALDMRRDVDETTD